MASNPEVIISHPYPWPTPYTWMSKSSTNPFWTSSSFFFQTELRNLITNLHFGTKHVLFVYTFKKAREVKFLIDVRMQISLTNHNKTLATKTGSVSLKAQEIKITQELTFFHIHTHGLLQRALKSLPDNLLKGNLSKAQWTGITETRMAIALMKIHLQRRSWEIWISSTLMTGLSTWEQVPGDQEDMTKG